MKAAILRAINSPLEIVDAGLGPLQFGQVSVDMIQSGICGAQLQEIRGEKGTHFPRFMGHEGVGIVREIGQGVTKVKAGDKVILHWRKGDGIESPSPQFILDGETMTAGQVTTFSEQTIVSENRVTPVEDGVSNDLSALLGCSLSTALATMEYEAKLKIGESVLVIGCGGVGLNLIRAAKMRGAGHITAVDCEQTKEESAKVAGANTFHTDYGIEILYLHLHAAGIMPRYDVVIDTSSNSKAIEMGLEYLAPSGRFIMIGQPRDYFTIKNGRAMFEGTGKTIMATQGGGFNPSQDIPRYVNAWDNGVLNLDGIVTHRMGFLQINDAIELVQNGLAGRVMITMNNV